MELMRGKVGRKMGKCGKRRFGKGSECHHVQIISPLALVHLDFQFRCVLVKERKCSLHINGNCSIFCLSCHFIYFGENVDDLIGKQRVKSNETEVQQNKDETEGKTFYLFIN